MSHPVFKTLLKFVKTNFPFCFFFYMVKESLTKKHLVKEMLSQININCLKMYQKCEVLEEYNFWLYFLKIRTKTFGGWHGCYMIVIDVCVTPVVRQSTSLQRWSTKLFGIVLLPNTPPTQGYMDWWIDGLRLMFNTLAVPLKFSV